MPKICIIGPPCSRIIGSQHEVPVLERKLSNDFVFEDFHAGNRYPRHWWVIASHRILWDVNTYPCPRYLPLAPKSTIVSLTNLTCFPGLFNTDPILRQWWIYQIYNMIKNINHQTPTQTVESICSSITTKIFERVKLSFFAVVQNGMKCPKHKWLTYCKSQQNLEKFGLRS